MDVNLAVIKKQRANVLLHIYTIDGKEFKPKLSISKAFCSIFTKSDTSQQKHKESIITSSNKESDTEESETKFSDSSNFSNSATQATPGIPFLNISTFYYFLQFISDTSCDTLHER
jgi:hypothetical protein